MKRYATYKGIHLTTPFYSDVRSRKGWVLFYLKEVDKEIYYTFKQWINDMLWLGYLLDITKQTSSLVV